MLCFLKRILPFTLTLIVGLALGSLFNLFNASTKPESRSYRFERSYATGSGGCRTRTRGYAATPGSATLRSAEIFYRPEPLYTAEARRNHTEGEVILRLTLGADGTVRDIETITQLPDGLTEQAKRAARAIQFTPATRDGSPVDEVKMITYSFNLD
jgi:TonB family protein